MVSRDASLILQLDRPDTVDVFPQPMLLSSPIAVTAGGILLLAMFCGRCVVLVSAPPTARCLCALVIPLDLAVDNTGRFVGSAVWIAAWRLMSR